MPHIVARDLSVAYAEHGEADASPVLLLHGWPDDASTWGAVAPVLADAGLPPRLGGMPTPPFEQAQRQWYHGFMATAREARAVRDDPHGFAHIHWVNWSPPGWFDEATFRKVAASFDNPDRPDVTLHSCRARWHEAAPDPRSRTRRSRWGPISVDRSTSCCCPASAISRGARRMRWLQASSWRSLAGRRSLRRRQA
ncbi:hypothetical protein [Sphingomonas sp.]|uniref:hypothetical protein n=1 Tax=Sphingomonas sp. TaxID=28214 RepID=UPI0035BC2917